VLLLPERQVRELPERQVRELPGQPMATWSSGSTATARKTTVT
jgi:hypothetical protein